MDAWGLFEKAPVVLFNPPDLLWTMMVRFPVQPGTWVKAENHVVYVGNTTADVYSTGFHKFVNLRDVISCFGSCPEELYEGLCIRRVKLRGARLLGEWHGWETVVADEMMVIPVQGDILYVEEATLDKNEGTRPA